MAWRDHPYTYQGYLFIHEPEVVFQAQVNEPLGVTYPLAEFEVDNITTGSITDVKAGYTLTIGNSPLARNGIIRVREDGSGTTIKIAETSERNGYGALVVNDNTFVTVYKERRIWPVAQRITATPTLFKDFDIAYDGGAGGRIFTEDYGPVAVMNHGPGIAANIDPSTSVITVEFSGTNSYTFDGTTSISAYSWDVDGGTITVGTAASSGITATFPEGVHYVSLTVTESTTGYTHTRYCLVAACNPGGATLDPITDFDVTEHVLTAGGPRMTFSIHDDSAQDIIGGSMHIYYEDEVYAGVAGSLVGPTGAEGVKFVGWPIDTESVNTSASEAGIVSFYERPCVGPLEYLDSLKGEGQIIERGAGGSPASWLEDNDLTTRRLAWYLIRWHTTLHELTDIRITITNTSLGGFASSNGTPSLRELLREAETIFTIYCDQRGRMLIDDPMEVRVDNATNGQIVGLTDADFNAVIPVLLALPRQRQIFVSGFDVSNLSTILDPIFSVAPGETPAVGVDSVEVGPFYVTGQTELNRRAGLLYNRDNATVQSIDLNLVHTGDIGIDPGTADTVVVTLAGQYFTRGQSISSTECEILGVAIRHTNSEGLRYKDVTINVRPVPLNYTQGVTYTP